MTTIAVTATSENFARRGVKHAEMIKDIHDYFSVINWPNTLVQAMSDQLYLQKGVEI